MKTRVLMEERGHDGKWGLHKARYQYQYHAMSRSLSIQRLWPWLSTRISNDTKGNPGFFKGAKLLPTQKESRSGNHHHCQEETRQRTMDQTRHGPAMDCAVHSSVPWEKRSSSMVVGGGIWFFETGFLQVYYRLITMVMDDI